MPQSLFWPHRSRAPRGPLRCSGSQSCQRLPVPRTAGRSHAGSGVEAGAVSPKAAPAVAAGGWLNLSPGKAGETAAQPLFSTLKPSQPLQAGGGSAGPATQPVVTPGGARGSISPVKFAPASSSSFAPSPALLAAAGGAAGTATPSSSPASTPTTHGENGQGQQGTGVAPPPQVSSGGTTPPSSISYPIIGNSSGPSLGQFTNFPLYTLDDTDGTILFPNDYQLATLNGWVDLRAQVRDTTVSTYSWDTTNLGGATSISGTSTYHLTFRWTNTVFTAHVSSVTLTVTNNSSQTEVQTYSFWVPAGNLPAWSGGSGSAPSWPQSLAPDTVGIASARLRLAERLGRCQLRRGGCRDRAALVQSQSRADRVDL